MNMLNLNLSVKILCHPLLWRKGSDRFTYGWNFIV